MASVRFVFCIYEERAVTGAQVTAFLTKEFNNESEKETLHCPGRRCSFSAPCSSFRPLSRSRRSGERFTANLVDPAGNFGRQSNTAPVLIHIDHYSSDAEVQRLAGILRQKGPDALRDALWDREVGFIRVGGGLGYPIAAARSRPAENGGRIDPSS